MMDDYMELTAVVGEEAEKVEVHLHRHPAKCTLACHLENGV